MTTVTMPSLGDAMEAATIVAWLRDEGAQVAAGEELVEVEADKATMTLPAPAAGRLRILAAVGDAVPVGAPLAELVPAEAPGDAPPAPVPAGAAAERSAEPAGNGAGGRAAPRPTPVALRAAAHHGIDPASVRGTGPLGRVRKRDVLAAAGVAEPAQQPDSTPPRTVVPAPPRRGSDRDVHELTPAQRTMARRMAEAKATQPDFAVELDVDMGAALELRERLRELDSGERPPSVNDIVVKAVARVLRDFPRVNGAYRDGMIETYPRVNVGVAVATGDLLVVATVEHADKLSLGEIAVRTRRLAARVRSGEVTPPELTGSTVTVSNLGMYGARAITPILNGGQAAILGLGAIEDRPVARDGRVAIRPTMTARIVCDHRIITGAEAAEFMAAVRGALEQPLRLAL